MIAQLVFILAFVTIGLGVVALAMTSGKKRKGGPTRGQRRLVAVGTAAVCVAVGIVLPAVVLVGAESKAEDAPGGVDLTASQADGRMLFKRNCSTCHALKASNAVGKVGPSLDVLRPPKELTLNAIQVGRARGMGQMPGQLLSGQDAVDVAEYVEAVAGRAS
jgi:mono/diheme cytochrome c family protein